EQPSEGHDAPEVAAVTVDTYLQALQYASRPILREYSDSLGFFERVIEPAVALTRWNPLNEADPKLRLVADAATLFGYVLSVVKTPEGRPGYVVLHSEGNRYGFISWAVRGIGNQTINFVGSESVSYHSLEFFRKRSWRNQSGLDFFIEASVP